MDCQDARGHLDAYADGELDLFRRVELERHIADCADCAARVKNLQTLKNAVSQEALYQKAPVGLRTRLQPVVLPNDRKPLRSLTRRSPMAVGILLCVALTSITAFVVSSVSPNADDRSVQSVLTNHIRSLQVDHATDVASTDQHTVKPWFRGKLDFAPKVPDLSQDGFVLSGGRLDYLFDRNVAALVYYRRLHPINVFTYPAPNDEQRPTRRYARQGFHIRHWQSDGMIHWAISDLNDQDLDEFVRKFQEQSAKPSNDAETPP